MAESINLIKEFKRNGKLCGFYACSTSMPLSLYSYYRMHAWNAYKANAADEFRTAAQNFLTKQK
ncbi:MAG: hypothetical protein IKA65_07870 [Lentisphaeria bacterium]|nr:hypothetical protein [Lentisphaeria bacterium]